MKTQIVDINQVKVNPDNPRTIKDEKFNQLVDSVKGFSKMLSLRPIVVDDNMMILGGNMRYEACVAAGFKKVTVIVASELTEEEKKEFIIKDNISGGEWDLQKLEDQYEFSVLADWGIDLEIPDMEEDETYTDKIDSVTYEPKGDKPELSDMLNEDKSNELKKRIKKYGDKVIQFSKKEIAQKFDVGDNFKNMDAVVYARNACFDLAEKKGIKYFLQLDDDYTRFEFRINDIGKYPKHIKRVIDLDSIIESYLRFFINTNIKSVAFSQGGDYIGGKDSGTAKNKMMRKCMNSFFCSTDRKFNFLGLINEDTTTYVYLQSLGDLFVTAPMVSVVQKTTQQNSGGLTDIYLQYGTYVKSFYTVMFCPSCVKIKKMGDKHFRLHHNVMWDCAVPKVIDEKHKKS